jgi:DNA-binding MarR family transcriptional regulator
MSALQHELAKRQPFDSPHQEAYLSIVRSAADLEGPFHALFKAHGLSPAGYNILRILRGHHDAGEPHGVRATEIGREMVVRVPDVTRLVDRLESQGLAERCRCTEDRRVVWVAITKKGLALLGKIDSPLTELHARVLGHLSERDLGQLIRLLEKARSGATAG